MFRREAVVEGEDGDGEVLREEGFCQLQEEEEVDGGLGGEVAAAVEVENCDL